MIRLSTPNGTIEFEDPAMTAQLLQHQQQVDADAMASAVFRATVYRVQGEPDPDLPFGGLLTKRLQSSERVVRDLITAGKLAYYCAAKKAYRVTETDVQDYEQKMKVRAA